MKTLSFVAGLTIKQALLQAHKVACNYDDTVLAIINDVVMVIDKETNVKDALVSYYQKINLKYEIERLRKQNEK